MARAADHTVAQAIDEQVARLVAEVEREYRRLVANDAPFQILIHASAGAGSCVMESQQTHRTKIN